MSRHVLMCEPVHYYIAYEINPWMRRANAVDRPRAARQWQRLLEALRSLDVEVELVEQGRAVPDMIFTANAGLVCRDTFFPSNFRFPERQPEAAQFVRWFQDHGYTIESIHEPHFWEGEGDVLFGGDRVYAGYRFRTEFRALDHLEEMLGLPMDRLELVDERFYHLDTCFCPLRSGTALYFPLAFSQEAQELLRSHVSDLIPVDEHDALRFACNALVVNNAVVLNDGCDRTYDILADRGFQSVQVPTDEFIKAGGSVKCLVLTLDTFTKPD